MKKIVIAFFSFSIFASSVYANEKIDNLNQQKSSISNQVDQLKDNIATYENDMDALLNEVGQLEMQIENLNGQIADKQKELDETNHKIKLLESEIKRLEADLIEKEIELERKKKIIAKNLTTMYAKGDVYFLEFLLRSDSLSNFLYRNDLLQKVLTQHKFLYDEVREQITLIKTKKEELQQKKTELESAKAKITVILKEIEMKKENVSVLLLDKQTKYNELKTKISQDDEVINQLIQEMTDLEKQIKLEKQLNGQNPNQNLPSGGDSSVIVGNDVIELAYKWVQQRGLGSNNPVIYSMERRQLDMTTYGDCSTFSRRIFLDAGYGNIGLNTAQQVSNPNGQFIENLSDIKPGDLMYFGPTGNHALYSYLPDGRKITTAHVALYVGNNKMIDLSSSVGTIAVKDFSSGAKWNWYVTNRFVGAKRF